MATAVQQRRGTTTEHNSFTGLEGEITVDTDKNTVVVHDGSTAGGIPLAKASEVSSVATQITTADEGADAECFPVFTTDAVGNLAPKTDTAFKYNASNGTLTTGGMTVNGAGTFNVGINTFNINSTGVDTALRVSTNSTTNDNAPDILIQRTALPNTSGETFHRCGDIKFQSRNDNSQDHLYGKIRCRAGDHRDGQELGRLDFFVASGTGGVFGNPGSYIEHSFTKDGLIVTGNVTATSYTGSQTISNYVTDTAIDVTEFASYVGKKIIYTGAASTISLPNVVAADIGKSWTIVNAGTGVITVDVDASGTAQQVRHAHAGGVNTSTTDRTIAIGGVVEIICIAEDNSGITNSSDKPNYLIYGGGVI